jgi:hypothetical protein
VYNLQLKRVIACQKTAHDSSVLHVAKLPNRYMFLSVLHEVKERHGFWPPVAKLPGSVA